MTPRIDLAFEGTERFDVNPPDQEAGIQEIEQKNISQNIPVSMPLHVSWP